jgi:hypothetical protein
MLHRQVSRPSADWAVNSWSNGMFNAMESDYFGSCLYFIVGVIVINFWMINLVVAVVVNTFKDIRASTKRSAFGAEKWVHDTVAPSRS